jgi:hypothetical protein
MKIHQFQIEILWLMLAWLSFARPAGDEGEMRYQLTEESDINKTTYLPAKARPPP